MVKEENNFLNLLKNTHSKIRMGRSNKTTISLKCNLKIVGEFVFHQKI